MPTPKQVESRMLKMPFQIGQRGEVAYVTAPQHMAAQEVQTIARTYIGERVMRPTFGSTADVRLFAGISNLDQDVIASEIFASLSRQEVQSHTVSVIVNLNPSAPGMLEIQIGYVARSLSTPETLTIPVTL